MSLYKRGTVWHFDFTVRGKRHRGSTDHTKKASAELVEAKLKTEAMQRGHISIPTGHSPMLSELYSSFENWIDTARSAKTGMPLDGDTRRYYKNGWRMLKETPIANMRVSQITKSDIGRLMFPGGPSNINNALRTLRRMLHRAKDEGYISDVPKITMAREMERTRIFTPAQERSLLEVAEQPLKDVATAIFDSGMRPESVFAMRWEHIRWTEHTLFVPKSKTHKGRRLVPLSQRLYSSLHGRWERSSHPQEGWVFPCRYTKAGKPRSACGHIVSVEKQFLRARKAANLPDDLVLYSSRHTFGTRLYNKTGNLKVVMEVMGHEETKTTMRYQHPEVDLARQAVDDWNREAAQTKQNAEATGTSHSASQLIQ